MCQARLQTGSYNKVIMSPEQVCPSSLIEGRRRDPSRPPMSLEEDAFCNQIKLDPPIYELYPESRFELFQRDMGRRQDPSGEERPVSSTGQTIVEFPAGKASSVTRQETIPGLQHNPQMKKIA